jgi:hypothetical protein
MSERIPGRQTLAIPIATDRNPSLPSTPTQRDIAAMVANAAQANAERDRGCAYRTMLEGSAVARFNEAAAFESLLPLCQEVSRLDLLDLGFDDGMVWVRFLAFLRSHNLSTAINLIAVRDTPPDVHTATLRMRSAAAASGIPFDSMFMVTAAKDWPGAIVRNGKALAVVANMSLHHIPDDGPHVDSLRTMVIRRIRRLEPRVVVVCETDFGPDAYRRLSRLGAHTQGSTANSVMDALAEMHEPKAGFKPMSMTAAHSEQESLTPLPLPTRPELPDRLENWRRRFFDAGYAAIDLMPMRGAIVRASGLVPQAVVAPDQQALRLSWRGRPIANATAWRPRNAP